MAQSTPISRLDAAKNADLVAEHLIKNNAQLNEGAAFELLYAWLQPKMPEFNRYAFGKLVRLWMHRQGKSFRETHRENLYSVLLPTFKKKPGTDADISIALGVQNQIALKFWVPEERLRLTLEFIDLPASYVLHKLDIVNQRNISSLIMPMVGPKTIQLLDLFYLANTKLNLPELGLFGGWLKEHFLTARGDQKKLGDQLAIAAHWSTKPAQPHTKSSADVSMSRLLNGRFGRWNVNMLHILTAFIKAKNPDAEPPWTVEKIATDYLKWRRAQPTL